MTGPDRGAGDRDGDPSGVYVYNPEKLRGFPGPGEVGRKLVEELRHPFHRNGTNDHGIGHLVFYTASRFALGFGAASVFAIGLGILLVASVFVRNLYCRFLCPLGAALGLVSKLAPFRIKRWSECSTCQLCEKACQWGAIRERKIIMTECVRCDDCEILYDSKTRCPHWLLKAKQQRRQDS